jgi:hypothetical protein
MAFIGTREIRQVKVKEVKIIKQASTKARMIGRHAGSLTD